MDTIIEDETFTEQSEQQPIKRPCCKCKKDSPYQCPQCKWFYCSLKCYQTHNLSCTEEFYKKNVIEHLKSKKVSPEEAKKMQKVLEKNKDKNELEFLSDHKHKRFEELLTLLQEGELTFDKLTPEETKEFSRFIKDGSNLQGMIKEWMPWWENEEYVYNLDIQEVNEQLPEFEDKKEGKLYQYRYDIKERYEKVPFIESLIQKEPSPEVNYHIVQYIFCFAYLCREYNGDLKNCHDTIVPTLISLAKCLTERISVPNVSVSLDNSLENIIQIDGTDAMPFIEVVLRDLANIYEKKFFLYEVFFRSYDVLHRYHEALDDVVAKEGGSEKGKKHKLEGKKIAGIKQKLIFYMAYLKRKTQEDLDVIKKEIKSYIREKVKNDALNREMEKIVRNYDPGVVFTHKTANM